MHDDLTNGALALSAGIAVGLLFSWLKLPLPAPPTLVGILGAAGVFLGSVIFHCFAR
jgi:XapX domain-containing protein